MSTTDDAATEHDEPRIARRPPRRVALFAAVAAAAWAADLVSKVLVAANLRDDHVVRLLGGALYLDQARNSGAAFSLGTGFTVALSVIAIAVVAIISRFAGRLRSAGWAVALGLILGGALGNLTDRIFREPGVFRGHVVDWISVFGPWGAHWPIFNLADAAIVCGAVLAGVLSLRGVPLEAGPARSPHPDRTQPEAAPPPATVPPDGPPTQPHAGQGESQVDDDAQDQREDRR